MLDAVSLLGVGLSTAAAVAFAAQYLFVRVGTTDGSVSDVMLVSLICNVVIVVPLAVAFTPTVLTTRSVLSFVAAGVFGSLLARVLEFKSVETIGASHTSPVVATNVIFATVLAVVFLGETISLLHLLGIVLVVGGVVVLSLEMSANDQSTYTLREVGLALALPLLAAFFIALEPIVVNVGYQEGSSVLTGFSVKAVSGLVGFVAYRRVVESRPVSVGVRRPEFRFHVGAGVANTAGIGLYFAALAVAPVSIIMPLLQSAPLFVVVLSAVFLPQRLERITLRLVTASLVVVVGATLVTLS